MMNFSTLTASSVLQSLAERVKERRIGPCRLLTLRTPVDSVVTWRGSFRSYPDFEDDEDLVQNVTASLLDKGTKRLDRFALAELLENRGAEVEFSSDGLFVEVSGRALRRDVSDVLQLTAEQLREPLLDAEELEKTKARLAASIQRSMENTGSQASGALTRRLYTRTHPNYTPAPEERLQRLAEIDVDAVAAYHETHFRPNEFILAIVGDIDEDAVEESVRLHFDGWIGDGEATSFATDARPENPGRTEILIPEKQNIDVRIGHELSIRRDHPDYIPTFLVNYVLGGNFSARLMQIIRDEMGLTYGIRSGLYGISTDYSGHWQVAVTLSQENVDRGIDATIGEIERFVQGGVTDEELSEMKTTIVGGFKVGLATTSGLAASLLKNAERGFDVGYLDRFPAEIEAVSLSEANDIIHRHFDPNRLHVTMAGMVDSTRLKSGL